MTQLGFLIRDIFDDSRRPRRTVSYRYIHVFMLLLFCSHFHLLMLIVVTMETQVLDETTTVFGAVRAHGDTATDITPENMIIIVGMSTVYLVAIEGDQKMITTTQKIIIRTHQ